jgi:hypothetical protein
MKKKWARGPLQETPEPGHLPPAKGLVSGPPNKKTPTPGFLAKHFASSAARPSSALL